MHSEKKEKSPLGNSPLGNLPLGLCMALGSNEAAMQAYSQLDLAAQQQLIDKARQVKSGREMHSLVNEITKFN